MVRRRIWVVQTDTAGCWWYRLRTPLMALDPDQFEVMWRGPEIAELIQGDIVIGQRIAGPNPAWLQICEKPGVLAVYDLDDNLLDVDPANTVPYSIYAPIHDDTAWNIAAADVVTVSTRTLAGVIRQRNPNVVVLPNCLPDSWLEPDPAGRYRESDLIWIGWAGSMFHQQDWTPDVVDALAELKATDRRIRYHMVGANYIGALADRVSPWSTMDALHAALDFDLGLAPLSPSGFNASKSWIKALEYAGRGIPLLGSFAGQYPEWCDQISAMARPGELVSPGVGWFDALQFMLNSRPTLKQRSAAAYEAAQAWTISKQIHRWTEVYSQ